MGTPHAAALVVLSDAPHWVIPGIVAIGIAMLALAGVHVATRFRHLRRISIELALVCEHIHHRIQGATPHDTCGMIRTPEVSTLRTAIKAIVRHGKAAAEGWQAIAERDALTGLANRWHFQREVVQQLDCAQGASQNSALIFIDIDGFKAVNDTQGHNVGDRLLRFAADRIGLVCRSPERSLAANRIHHAPQAVQMARLGGDEFAVFLPGIASDADARNVAGRIQRVMADPFEVDGCTVAVSASIGVAVAPRDGHTYEDLLRAADTAMYHAKRRGRNRAEFYAVALDEDMRCAADETQELRDALSNGEFELYFQPLYDCNTLRIKSVEALIRWNHPQRGLILPGKFIPLAEQIGLMDQLGEWVLAEAIGRIRLFADLGFPLLISVNVSPIQLQHRDFVALVRCLLARFQAEPKLLELEITESVAMDDFDLASDRLSRIAALGVSIAIDDFGTGYSNLASVIRLPFSRLKLDRTLLQDLTVRPEAHTLMQTIISMANGLGLHSVAEGVETNAQLDLLGAMGCDFVQGFLLSRPVREADLLNLLRNEQAGAANAPIKMTA